MKTNMLSGIAAGLLLAAATPLHAQIFGSGTVNYISKFNAVNNITNSLLYDNGTNIGLGTVTPATKLNIFTASTNDGIRIQQTGTTACALGLFNSSASARNWALFSTGSGNLQGPGNFSIYDYTSGSDRIFIKGTSGFIGMGTINPAGNLHIVGSMPDNVSGQPATRIDYNSNALTSLSDALDVNLNINNTSIGVQSYASGVKSIITEQCPTSANSHGLWAVWAETTGKNAVGSALYAKASNACGGPVAPAGVFDGTVYGTAFVTTSDARLKDNIKPMQNSMEKLMQLAPKTYTYITDDKVKQMNLPEGEQYGLLAQDLEKVFPGLVTEAGHPVVKADGTIESVPVFKAVNYTALVPVMLAGMQEQQKMITELKAQVEQLQKLATGTGEVTMNAALLGNAPNPASDNTRITTALDKSVEHAVLVVYDIEGKEVLRQEITERGLVNTDLPVSQLKSGTYIYTLISDNMVTGTRRFVVAH
jgi:hypothetical protein